VIMLLLLVLFGTAVIIVKAPNPLPMEVIKSSSGGPGAEATTGDPDVR
jgi:hypothetical protein